MSLHKTSLHGTSLHGTSLHGTLRNCLSSSADEVIIFATDIRQQPARRGSADPAIRRKAARSLPLAQKSDIVVLSAPTNQNYLQWLHGLQLGPGKIVVYTSSAQKTVSEEIIASPQPLAHAISELGTSSVLVPFYSGNAEAQAAKACGAELFGCDEETTLKFFNKNNFKNLLKSLGVPVVDGSSHHLDSTQDRDSEAQQMLEVMEKLLGSYTGLIVRGSLGAGGSSVHVVEHANRQEVLQKIRAEQQPSYLIEPLLDVIASPNDQWCIKRDGAIYSIGVSLQLFEGYRHCGNVSGGFISERVRSYMAANSGRIVEAMAQQGYRGITGIDYIICNDGIYPIENNARLNGSSFAFGIVDNLAQFVGEIACWKFFKARVPPCSFPELTKKLGSLIYDGTTVNSVFPFDCDGLEHDGALEILLIGEDIYHLQHLEGALSRLGMVHY